MSLLLLLRPDYADFIPDNFHGDIDEIAVYPSALSASRIRQHYQTAKAIPGRYYDEVITDAPEGFWRLDEAAASSTFADSANSHDGSKSVTASRVEGALGLGASTSASENRISFYFREVPLDLQTQLDIDGTTMAELNAAGNQPDYDVAKYTNRTQADLDLENQTTLDGDTQFNLERLPDYVSDAYIEVRLKWSAADSILEVLDANGTTVYTFDDFTISPDYYYYVMANVEGNSVRVRIYQIDEAGNFGSPEAYGMVLDTTAIVNEDLFKRRKGRFGWYARFADGDASLNNIRPRSQSFGEIVTKTFASSSPVEGARLQVAGSSDRTLFETLGSGPWGGNVITDTEKSRSGNGFKITSNQNTPLQGVQTNLFTIDDFDHTEISFDLFFPSYALSAGSNLEAFLYGRYANVISLNLGGFVPDQWHRVKAYLRNDLVQGGDYRLIIVQSLPATDTTWYLDNISIVTRTLEMSGRATRPDAWGMQPENWVPFKDTVNQIQSGTLFAERGKEIQIRGKALRQDSYIHEIRTLPKYAELGRFYWSDEHAPSATVPAAVISSVADGRTVTFDGSSSTNTGGTNVAWYWSFGDGTYDYGVSVTHSYAFSGSYEVTLVVIDEQGRKAVDSATVSV